MNQTVISMLCSDLTMARVSRSRQCFAVVSANGIEINCLDDKSHTKCGILGIVISNAGAAGFANLLVLTE